MVKAIRHAGIVVTDMERSVRFYGDLLGLKVVKDFWEKGEYIDSITGLEGVYLHMVKLTAKDGSMIELLQYKSHPCPSGSERRLCDIGCTHVAFTVDDIKLQYSRLKEQGVEFLSVPSVSPDGYAKVAFCRDPDGFFIELVEVLDKDGKVG
jgi:catechol 2,3-dioxygenase-like lactoylglutathione lyase family enzyme